MDAGALTMDGNRFGPTDYHLSSEEPAEAIRLIGTNGIPYLLKELQRTDSRLEQMIAKIAPKVGFSPHKPMLATAEGKRAQALTALRILGTNALVAIPELTRMTNHSVATIRYSSHLILSGLSATPPTNWFTPP